MVVLIVQFVINQINEHYYWKFQDFVAFVK